MKRIRIQLVIGILIISGLMRCSQGSEGGSAEGVPRELTVSSTTNAVCESPYPARFGTQVRSIILCIGDGMGMAQTTLGRLVSAGTSGKLTMEQLPYVAIVRTHAAKQLTTDSAAAATALATGFKTSNGTVSMSPDGEQEYVTILELAKARGMSVGLVVLSTLSHATPAGFGAHVGSRGSEREIAAQMITKGIDVLFGGGTDVFLPQKRKWRDKDAVDGRDLVSEAKKAGYEVVKTRRQFMNVKKGPVLGLFAPKYMTDGPIVVSLAEMTSKAIEILNRNTNGFFLMVEGSDIDWGCHAGDPMHVADSVIAFDEAIRKAADFALADKQTVLIVTADHETGGLSILDADEKTGSLKTAFAVTGHTAVPVPLYAFGPQAEIFAGVYDNTEVPKKIATILKISGFPTVRNRGKR